MPEIQHTPSEKPTPHVIVAEGFPLPLWIDAFDRDRLIAEIRETLKRVG